MDSTELVIPGLDWEEVGTLMYARGFKQYCEMIKRIQAGECFFCQLDTELNIVIFENERWWGWYNPVKIERANLAYHAVIAHRQHLTQLSDLTPEDGYHLFDIVQKFAQKDNLPGGGMLMRFGDPRLNAGTIRHLHLNIMVPNGKGEVRPPLRKTMEEVEEDMKKSVAFEKMRLGTPFEALEPAEQDLVRDRLK